MAGRIALAGLASGLDTSRLIQELLAYERRPIADLERRQHDLEAARQVLGSVRARLAALEQAAAHLADPTGVRTAKIATSDAAVLTATGAGASAGLVASLVVESIARGSVALSTVGVDDPDAPLGLTDGGLVFRLGFGPDQGVEFTPDLSLRDLAAQLDALGGGVRAHVVNVGSSDIPDYRLRLVSDATGEANTIIVTTDHSGLGVTTTQIGTDASVRIDGVGVPLRRSTNVIEDILPGVRLSLHAPGAATLTVTDDVDATVAAVEALVARANEAMGLMTAESSIARDAATGDVRVGRLAGDGAFSRVVGRLRDALVRPLAGATPPLATLASLGIVSDAKTGALRLDAAKLRAAFAADPDGVSRVLAGEGANEGVADRVVAAVRGALAETGAVDARDRRLADELDRVADGIAASERRITMVEARLRAEFAALERLLGQLNEQGTFLAGALGRGGAS